MLAAGVCNKRNTKTKCDPKRKRFPSLHKWCVAVPTFRVYPTHRSAMRAQTGERNRTRENETQKRRRKEKEGKKWEVKQSFYRGDRPCLSVRPPCCCCCCTHVSRYFWFGRAMLRLSSRARFLDVSRSDTLNLGSAIVSFQCLECGGVMPVRKHYSRFFVLVARASSPSSSL